MNQPAAHHIDPLVPFVVEAGEVRITLHPPPAGPPSWWPEHDPWVGRWLWRLSGVIEGPALRMEDAIDAALAAALAWLEGSLAALRGPQSWWEGRFQWAQMHALARCPRIERHPTDGWTWSTASPKGPEESGRFHATAAGAQNAAVMAALEKVEADLKLLKIIQMRTELAKEVGGDLLELWQAGAEEPLEAGAR